MKLAEFKDAIEYIYAYFHMAIPAPKTVEYWYDDVKYIPAGRPMEYILNGLKGRDNLPRNMAGAWRQGYFEWKNNHSGSDSNIQKKPCSTCKTRGHFIVEVFDIPGRRSYPTVYRCGDCENWRDELSHTIPSLTEHDIKERGLKVL